MKNYFLIVLLFLASYSSWGQKGELEIGLTGGLNIAFVADSEGLGSPKNLYKFTGRFSAEYEIVEHLRAEIGFGVLTKGLEFITVVTDQNVNPTEITYAQNKLKYFSTQILIKGRFGKKFKVLPSVGFSFDRLISHKLTYEPEGSFLGKTESFADEFNNWCNGLLMGVHTRYPITAKIEVGLSVQLNLGQNEISSTTEGQKYGTFPSNYLVLAGVFWQLK